MDIASILALGYSQIHYCMFQPQGEITWVILIVSDRVIYIRNYAHGGTVDGAVDSYLEMKRNNEVIATLVYIPSILDFPL